MKVLFTSSFQITQKITCYSIGFIAFNFVFRAKPSEQMASYELYLRIFKNTLFPTCKKYLELANLTKILIVACNIHNERKEHFFVETGCASKINAAILTSVNNTTDGIIGAMKSPNSYSEMNLDFLSVFVDVTLYQISQTDMPI